MASEDNAGGFMLSPPPSSVASSSLNANTALPHPRASPLRPGGSKESTFIRYVDKCILHIQRRFAKRTTPVSDILSNVDREKADVWHDVKGYSSMRQACEDIEELVGVVWVSGTPSLQVPNLISLALLLTSIVVAMPPTPKYLFRLLGKLDHAFASLIQGRDVDTSEALPGFESRKGISDTEKVRIRSLIERTRVSVVEVFKKGEFELEEAYDDEDEAMQETDDDDDDLVLENPEENDAGDDVDTWDMQLARVYDRTMVELGDTLSMDAPIGIVTERRG